MKKLLCMVLCMALLVPALGAMAQDYADGTFTGSATGMGGAVEVSVTVEGGKITAVEVLSQKETPGISDAALAKMPGMIVEAQGWDVDSVTGATVTSTAIKEAVKSALTATGEEEKAEFAVNIDYDVIVVGAGMAGLCATARATQLGGKVLLLEQSPRIGGSANTAGGSISGAAYQLQKAAGIDNDSPETFYADMVQLGGEEFINTEVSQKHAANSGAAIDWLQDYVGVEFGDTVNDGAYTKMNVPRVTYTVGGANSGGGIYFVEALSKKLDAEIANGNVQLALDTMVTDVLTDENNDIVGVQVGDLQLKADSVIIATGGYGYCEEWLKEYNFTNITSNDPNTAIGSGYNFARKAGAAFDNMDYCSCYAGSVPVSGFQASLKANVDYTGAVWVDMNGNRLYNEPTAGTMDKRLIWRGAQDNVVYVILSEGMLAAGEDLFYVNLISNVPAEDSKAKLNELIEGGVYAFKADTIDELGEKIGAANLKPTIDLYNEGVAAGQDAQFGRTDKLIAFSEEQGPFYAIYTIPYLMMTAGGPRINADAQLVREDGSVVKGAYLAGEIIGSANIGGHITIGGIGHGMNATWGRIAAENALINAGVEIAK